MTNLSVLQGTKHTMSKPCLPKKTGGIFFQNTMRFLSLIVLFLFTTSSLSAQCGNFPDALNVYKVSDSTPACGLQGSDGSGIFFANDCNNGYHAWKAGNDLYFVQYDDSAKLLGTVTRNGIIGDVNITFNGVTSPGSSNWNNACYTSNISDAINYHEFSGGISLSNGGYLSVYNPVANHFILGNGASNNGTTEFGFGGWPDGTIGNCTEMFGNLELCSSCDQVTDGGSIVYNGDVPCGAFNPSVISSAQLPSGGSGAIEYLWLSSTTSCPTQLSQAIDGANNATYNPGVLTETTYFVRCSRRAGCDSWGFGESNCVTIEVETAPSATVSNSNPSCGDNDGSISFAFDDNPHRSNIEFSLDGGNNYDLNVLDNVGTASFSNLTAGTYDVFVRWGNNECEVDLGSVTLTDGAQAPGITCNDGDDSTINDTIQEDGCTCTGKNPPNNDASIGNFVFNDTNGNGLNDNGEQGIDGVTVTLQTPNGATVATTTTVDEGFYNFNNLPAGDYKVTFTTPANFTASPQTGNATDGINNDNDVNPTMGMTEVFTLAAGENNPTIDAGFTPNGGGGGETPDCADITISAGDGSVVISGLDGAPVTSVQIFNSAWNQEFACFADCNTPTEIIPVTAGEYLVYVKYYTESYILICEENATITVGGGGPVIIDNDNDGFPAVEDCDDNDPSVPATVGSSCNDGNDNTSNDVIMADGCTCVGTPNGGGVTDNDNDGVPAEQDCNDNDPSVPAAIGSSCNDGNGNTSNDIIQADGCTCAGTVDNGGGTPDCANIGITSSNGNIVITGLDGAPVTSVQVFNMDWQGTFSCFADCNSPMETIPVADGEYLVYVKYYTASYSLVCEENVTITVGDGGTGIVDNDNDGVPAVEDCDDNDPSVPATVGSSCNDGNANTNNDVILADGCSCAGTPNDGGVIDNDNDGVPAGEDCDDNDPSVPTTVGSSCNDGNADTNNDVILADGCSCAGTPNGGGGNEGVDLALTATGDGNDVDAYQAFSVTFTLTNEGTSSSDNIVVNIPQPEGVVFEGNNPFNASAGAYDYYSTFNWSVGTLAPGQTETITLNYYSIAPGPYTVYGQVSNASGIDADSTPGNGTAPTPNEDDEAVYNTGGNTGGITDNDNDGVPAGEDCDDNDPSVPATVGSSCNDGNANTSNDVILADGCSCEGTPNGGGLTDNDNDGVPAGEDCDDNDPSVPAIVGSSCNDGNNATENDVILADGCSCEGTPIDNGSDNCDDIFISEENGMISVSGMGVGPLTAVWIFDAAWNTVFNCSYGCQNLETYQGQPGTYFVIVKKLNPDWSVICEVEQQINIAGTPQNDILTLTGPDNQTVNAAPGANSAVVTYPEPIASTTCVDEGLELVRTAGPASGSEFPIGTTTITYQATDACDNTETVSFTITVVAQDSELTLTGPDSQTVTAAPGATTATVTYPEPIANTTCAEGGLELVRTAGPVSGSTFPIGTTTITYQATDNCGNTEMLSFTITVNPTDSDLTLTQPADQTVDAAPGANSAVVTYPEPVANTTCAEGGLELVRTEGPASGSAFPIGTTTITYVATDACGDTETVSFTITVNPQGSMLSLTNPGNQTVTAPSGANSAVVTYPEPVANTTCALGGLDLVRIAGPASGSTFPVGTTTITYQATDACDNSETVSFTITVEASDSVVSISCPANMTVDTAPGATSAIVTYGNASATTNCAQDGLNIAVTQGPASGSAFPVGTTTVKYTATDACGGMDMCTFTVTVNAVAAPDCEITRSATNATQCVNGESYGIYVQGDYYTVSNASLTEYSDGTAILAGTANGLGAIHVEFTGRTSSLTPLFGQCYTPSTNDWYYYSAFSGTIGSLNITGNPAHPFQIGNGANNQNQNAFGGSGWWNASNGQTGDINLRLSGNANTLQFDDSCEQPVAGCNLDVLFVVGSTNLSAGDAAIKNRLTNQGYNVMTVDAQWAEASDANGKDLVLISSTVLSTDLGNTFKHVAVPVMTWEAYLFDDMAMTGNSTGTSYDTQWGVQSYTATSHPINGNLSGTFNIFTSDDDVSWGLPVSASNDAGYIPGSPNRCLITAYDEDDAMFGNFHAPARRVGFFLRDNNATKLTAKGWQLFDQSIQWLTNCTPANGTIVQSIEDENALIAEERTEVKETADFAFGIYPNPATDMVNVSLVEMNGAAVIINVYDALGRNIESVEADAAYNSVYRINTSDYKSGMYMISVQTGDAPAITKQLVILGH